MVKRPTSGVVFTVVHVAVPVAASACCGLEVFGSWDLACVHYETNSVLPPWSNDRLGVRPPENDGWRAAEQFSL